MEHRPTTGKMHLPTTTLVIVETPAPRTNHLVVGRMTLPTTTLGKVDPRIVAMAIAVFVAALSNGHIQIVSGEL